MNEWTGDLKKRKADSLMLALIHDDTWNVLNLQHMISNLKTCGCSDIPGGGTWKSIYQKTHSHSWRWQPSKKYTSTLTHPIQNKWNINHITFYEVHYSFKPFFRLWWDFPYDPQLSLIQITANCGEVNPPGADINSQSRYRNGIKWDEKRIKSYWPKSSKYIR